MLNIKTKLGWDKVKGITVIADEDVKKGSCITYFDPDYDLVLRKHILKICQRHKNNM